MSIEMSRPSANLRLFVAMYPPVEIAAALLEQLKSLKLPPHRAAPREQVHLTVQFIGDTPAKEMDNVIESVLRASAGIRSFPLRPQKLISLPERGPARLVAAQTDSPPLLMELHRRLVVRLARSVRDRGEERFCPHLTLCRFQSPVRGLMIGQSLSIPPFTVSRIALMRSTLTHDGAQHVQVAASELQCEF